MAASSPVIDGRKISDFKVFDLRQELEKRGHDSKGLKADLMKRLEKVLIEDGALESSSQAIPETQDEGKASGRRSTPRRRSQKIQKAVTPKEVETDGTEDLSQQVEGVPDNFQENEQLSHINNTNSLSDSLIVNANDSVAQGLETVGPYEESSGDIDNPDEFFEENAYVEQSNVEDQEEFVDEDCVQADFDGNAEESFEVVDDEEEYEMGEEEEEHAEDEYAEQGTEEGEGIDQVEPMEEEFDEQMKHENSEEFVEESDIPSRDLVDEGHSNEEYEEYDQENVEDFPGEEGALIAEEEEEQSHVMEEGMKEPEEVSDEQTQEAEEDTEEAEVEEAEAVKEPDENENIESERMEEDGDEEEFVGDSDVLEVSQDGAEATDQTADEDTLEVEINQKSTDEEVKPESANQPIWSSLTVASSNSDKLNDETEVADSVGKEDEVEIKLEVNDFTNEQSEDKDTDKSEMTENLEVKKDELIDSLESKVEGEEKCDAEAKEKDISENVKLEAEKDTALDTGEQAIQSSSSALDEKESKVASDKTEDTKKGEEKDEKSESAEVLAAKELDAKKEIIKSIWISGLSSVTRAADLKTKFSQYGKVVGAKVVTSARSPGTHCFGFVTMSSCEEAATCIEKLNKNEIHGKIVTVERAKNDPTPKKPPPKQDKKTDEKKPGAGKTSTSPQKSSRSQKASSSLKKEDSSTPAENKSDELSKPSDKDKKVDEKSDRRRDSDRSRTDSRSDRRASDHRRRTRSRSRSRRRSRSRERRRSRTPKRSQSKDQKKTDDSKDDKSKSEETDKKKVRSLDELKKERQAKIDKERKLREERRRKEREKERELREERRRAQELREKERRERERREEDRMRREREKQREIEREREQRKRRERERLQRERREKEKEREEKERLEKERIQREARLERERIERERLQRERLERERLEKERLDRERQERERVERERLKREKEELERIRTERERLERERLEVEKRYALKRAAPPMQRDSSASRPEERNDYFPKQKMPAPESVRGAPGRPMDFFGGPQGRAVFNELRPTERGRLDTHAADILSSSRKDGGGHSSRDDSHRSRDSLSSRSRRDSSPYSYSSSRGKERNSPISAHSSDGRRSETAHRERDERRETDVPSSRDYRKVISSRDNRERSPLRRSSSDNLREMERGRLSESKRSDRSSGRGDKPSNRDGEGIQYYDTEETGRPWLDSSLRNPPKTLNEILERAGVSGILGNTFSQAQVALPASESMNSSSRYKHMNKPDWRDDRREEMKRPGISERDVRLGLERSAERHHTGLHKKEDTGRRQDIDIGISKRAQELLLQAKLHEQQPRERLLPSQPIHSREMQGREMQSRDAMQRSYSQRGAEPQPRDVYERSLPRQDIPQRGFPSHGVPSQQPGILARSHPIPGSQRPMSSQENWNRGRPAVPNMGGNFPMMSGGRGQNMQGRDMGKQGIQGLGIPSHIRRF